MIGAGWIGLEVTSAAVGYGNQVTVVEPQAQPLLGALGPELGALFADLHREHGVDAAAEHRGRRRSTSSTAGDRGADRRR